MRRKCFIFALLGVLPGIGCGLMWAQRVGAETVLCADLSASCVRDQT
jgi:hypothetical protein